MASVGIVKTLWTGTSGGVGLSQMAVSVATGDALNTTQAQSAVNAVRTMWNNLRSYIPDEVSLTVLPEVLEYEPSTSVLQAAVQAASAPAVVTGTGTGNYSMASGIKVVINTNSISFGRRVKGGFYIVPADQGGYTSQGVPSATFRGGIATEGATLLSSLATAGLNLNVYRRHNPKAKHPDGAIFVATGISAPTKVAILRGRRD